MAPIPALGLLVLGLVSFRIVADQAPAFDEGLLVEGITGDTRLINRAAMYDEGSYLFQMGYGYVMADALSFAGIEAPDEIASTDIARQRLERAETLLEDSLRHDPANAHAWFYYAQALAAVSDIGSARNALETSWYLGPTTHRLSLPRLFLIQTIRSITGDDTAYVEIEQADLELLGIHQPNTLRHITQEK